MKRLERRRFNWPSGADGLVTISTAQLAHLAIRRRLAAPAADRKTTSVGQCFWLANGEGPDSITSVTAPESLPTDLAAAHASILAERAARLEAAATSAKTEAASAQADR
ncbi:hypothetical protein ABIB00_007412 [Bradyrhizobium sp. LB14.3]|uniref:hypothetical protein n=1 Tax=Bradyrhizobium sp. LB14.3 TaxID=3156328 RepID=UPI00339A99FF